MRAVVRLRGYTFVELMMAIAVMVIGVGGVFAMQQVTITSNMHAKNLGMATHLAQSWLDELSAESSQWNGTNDFAQTVWLRRVGDEGAPNPAWFLPEYDAGRRFGPAFDALGNPVASANVQRDAHFCTHLRLTWLSRQERGSTRGTGLIRAEARVFWRRYGISELSAAPPTHVCAIAPGNFDQDDGPRLFHVVYLSTAIRQHPEGT